VHGKAIEALAGEHMVSASHLQSPTTTGGLLLCHTEGLTHNPSGESCEIRPLKTDAPQAGDLSVRLATSRKLVEGEEIQQVRKALEDHGRISGAHSPGRRCLRVAYSTEVIDIPAQVLEKLSCRLCMTAWPSLMFCTNLSRVLCYPNTNTPRLPCTTSPPTRPSTSPSM
jgi:hypothetical protein